MADDLQSRVHEFAQDAAQAFPLLDANQDKVVDRAELRAAITNPNITGTAAETAAALYFSAQPVQQLTAPDAAKSADKSVSISQIQSLDAQFAQRLGQCSANPVELSTTFLPPTMWSVKTLLALDKNLDRLVSRDELSTDELSADGEVTAFLRRHYDEIVAAGGGDPAQGFNFEMLDKFMKSVDAQCGGLWDMRGILRRIDQARGADVSRALFANQDNPVSSVNADAIKQGVIGDCQFLASLATVASNTPDAIVKMIKDNGDQTYTVTFPGAPDKPITVPRPTDAELILFNGAGKYGTWATVLEKAFAEYKKQHSAAKDEPELAQEAINAAASPEDALRMLTGAPVRFVEPLFTKTDELRELLSRDGVSIVCGVSMFQQVVSGMYDYPANHAYSVLGFDPGGADGGTVIMRNPWGRESGPKGTFKVSFNQFRALISGIYVAGPIAG